MYPSCLCLFRAALGRWDKTVGHSCFPTWPSVTSTTALENSNLSKWEAAPKAGVPNPFESTGAFAILTQGDGCKHEMAATTGRAAHMSGSEVM